MGALAALRERPGSGPRAEKASPLAKLVAAFALILLVSLSRSPLFLETAAAFELLWLCVLPAECIARVLRKLLAALAFAALIFLPAALSGLAFDLASLVAKVLLAVLAAALLSATTSWPSMAGALAALRVPDVFLVTLDLTVKYIVLLGGLVLDMLCALKLRSVGRNDRKTDSLAAIAGTVFLKSMEAAEDEYQAMECRCFTGSYRGVHGRARRYRLRAADALFIAATALIVGAFAFFGMGRPLWTR
jgi:ABC-type cobalt transport system, permease component CbiQ and related transporters